MSRAFQVCPAEPSRGGRRPKEAPLNRMEAGDWLIGDGFWAQRARPEGGLNSRTGPHPCHREAQALGPGGLPAWGKHDKIKTARRA